jgi:Ca-activated chloride channel family protein
MTFLPFARWWVLLFLVIPVALLIWVWKRADRRVVLPFDHGRKRSGVVWFILLNLAESLPALVLTVVILLLAEPVMTGAPKEKRALTNIEFCVDVSGSMTAPFGEGNRYDAAMKAVEDFLDARRGDAYGLTFFGNNVLHWVPLTSDVSALRCAPPFMKPDKVPPWLNGTEIAKALRACKNVLIERQQGDRMIILVTDGFSFDLTGGNDMIIGKELKDNNITVFAIVIGDEKMPDEVVNIAAITGGEAFEATNPEALKVVFHRIDQMKQARLEKTLGETMDNFFWYCVVGLSALGMGTLTLFGLRYTPW